MPDGVEFALDDGTTVVVAVPAREGSNMVGLGDRLETAQKTFREALAPVTAAAAQVIDGFRKAGHRPDEIEISFGVTLDGRAGGVIAEAKAGAHLEVRLRWSGSGTPPDDERLPAERARPRHSSPSHVAGTRLASGRHQLSLPVPGCGPRLGSTS